MKPCICLWIVLLKIHIENIYILILLKHINQSIDG